MAKRRLIVCVALAMIVANLNNISAIICWRCDSSSKFCGDSLESTNLTKTQLSYYYIQCGPVRRKVNYKGDKMIAKCMMRIDLAYERLVYTRQCVEEAENANANACLSDEWFNDNDNPNIRMMSCETCTEEDGCNREIKNYFVTEVQSSHGNNFRLTVAPKTIFCLLIIFIYSYCKL